MTLQAVATTTEQAVATQFCLLATYVICNNGYYLLLFVLRHFLFVSSHCSVSYVNYKKKGIEPKNAFLSSRKCLNASFYEDYSGPKTYYETCNNPRLVNGRTNIKSYSGFIYFTFLTLQQFGWFSKGCGSDSALLIHCSAKSFWIYGMY